MRADHRPQIVRMSRAPKRSQESNAQEGRLVLQIRNDFASLGAGQDALRRFLAAEGASEDGKYRTELVFEELITNVIRHAYAQLAPSTESIEVVVRMEPQTIRLTVEDDGPAFDPARAPLAPLPASIDEAKVGGLGLRLIRDTARRIHYKRVAGKNSVTVCLDRF